MDKNQRTGLFLLLALLTVWMYFTAPTQEEIDRHQRMRDSIAQATKLPTDVESVEQDITNQLNATPTVTDSAAVEALSGTYGAFAASARGEQTSYKLDNGLITLHFNSKGGAIEKAYLSEYKKIVDDADRNELKKDLFLMEDAKNSFEYILPLKGIGNISTKDLYFQGQQQGNTITLTANTSNGKSIQQIYTLKPDSYHIDYQLKLNGVASLFQNGTDRIKLKWNNYLDKIEKNTTFEKYYSTVYFKEQEEDSDYCSCRSDDEETSKNKLDWVSHSHQFFNTTLIAKDAKFENGKFETVMLDDAEEDLKLLKTEFDIPISNTVNESISYAYYIGPNKFEVLNAYDNGMEEIIPFGRSLFGSINRWIIRPSFNWLSKYIGSKGVVIIVLIFILKMLLYPLMYKMLQSQAKMGALKPELAKMKEKFKDDPQAQQMETMKVYREYGVSPLGGCMPMLLQMPIWYALFRFFPASLTFRQEPFLWASDLSSYDSIMHLPFAIPAFGDHISLFTILWAISTVAYTYYNSKHMDLSANPAMKYVQYFMPVMFLFFFNNYASGLTCYMFFSNIFNVLQTVLTKKFVFNDEKILAELHQQKAEKAKKPKKKNSFQARLEEAMKQQQLAQQQKEKNNKKKK